MLEKAPSVIINNKVIELMTTMQESGALQKIQDQYLYWDKVKYRAKKTSPQELWSAVKLYRILRKQELKFHTYYFHFVNTDAIQKSIHFFDKEIGEAFTTEINITKSDKTKIILSSIMEEAISSSQMEGANTTRQRAKEMIQQGSKPRNKSEQMILNNFITMKYIVQHKDEDLTLDNLMYIHKLVSNGTLDNKEEEGSYRRSDDVYVVNHTSSEVIHRPPLEVELKRLLHDLCHFFNNEDEVFIHPVIKGIIIHFIVGWIHPFTDGNGRTARALFYWYMLKKGYWLTEYLSISAIIKDHKAQYEKAYLYTEADENDLTYFIVYNLKIMEQSFIALKEHLGRKQKEMIQSTVFMKIPGVNERMAQILKLLHDDPNRIMNAKEIEARFNISNYTARSDLKSLVSLGFMEVIQVNKQKQNFIKSKHFERMLKKFKV